MWNTFPKRIVFPLIQYFTQHGICQNLLRAIMVPHYCDLPRTFSIYRTWVLALSPNLQRIKLELRRIIQHIPSALLFKMLLDIDIRLLLLSFRSTTWTLIDQIRSSYEIHIWNLALPSKTFNHLFQNEFISIRVTHLLLFWWRNSWSMYVRERLGVIDTMIAVAMMMRYIILHLERWL